GRINNYEVQLLTTSGKIFWVSLSATVIEYMGEPCFFIAFIDISRRKELEEKIQKSEELYRSVVTASPDAIAYSNLHGIMTMISPAGVKMFGSLTSQDFIGHHVLEFIHPDDAPQAQERMLELIKGYKLQLREYRGRRVDGTFFPYEIHSELTHDDAGQPAGIVYVIRDITERKEADELIHENEERFATIFQEVPVPLLILDESGVILEINATGEQRFQVSRDQIVGMQVTSPALFSDSGEGDPYQFILGHNPGKSLETRFNLPDGTWRYVTIRSRFITLRRSPAILLLIHDIDDIKRAQNALTQANAQINLLNSITRHDILNRVTVVMSYSEFLHEKVRDPSSLTYISRIHDSGKDIQHLIEFTKQYQDLGVKKPEWQRIDLILKSRSIQPLLQDITVHLPKSSCEIYADPMLEKVMYNLIENSCRHGQTVTEFSIYYVEENDHLLVRYTDNGVGIPLSEKPMIFKKGHGKNTGLGLFLIREILQITGITITENGIPGEGVRFEMRVPVGSFRFVGSS
ncbi:MAG: PAS domain-containing sensor histidine kinase, partial [Methanobacteriota archaeon]